MNKPFEPSSSWGWDSDDFYLDEPPCQEEVEEDMTVEATSVVADEDGFVPF